MKNKSLQGISVFVLCLMVSLFCGCADSKLNLAVEAANSNCPVNLGMSGEMTHISYEGDVVEFLFTLNEQLINIDKLASEPEMMKTSLAAGIVNEKTKKLLELIIESKSDFSVVMKGKTSGKEAQVRLTPSELEELLNKPMASNDEKLSIAIAQTNVQMPMDAGTGIVITELVDKGEAVVYMAKVSDPSYLSMISSSLDEMKNSQKMMFNMMGPSEKYFFKLIVDAGKDLGYIYYADGTDEKVEIYHTNAELKELIK